MKYSNAKIKSTFRLKYIKDLCLRSIFIFLVFTTANSQSSEELRAIPATRVETFAPVSVGAENIETYIHLMKGKKVGLVGNQSSIIGRTHLVDTLLDLGIDIRKVFSPEHGFRGSADAGEHISNETDDKTGLPIVSLYGNNKKPTNQQLADLDVLLFDIQDVGVRFYTYISTLHYVMEACSENSVPLIVLDRPNPNGHYVDGPILDPKFTSFVGMHPVPIVHGMTIGEYAQMINGERWLKDSIQCDLVVIPCANYNHNSHYSLPVPPSPNLRSDLSIQLYPSLCLLEATTVTIGRGTDAPFECYGHPDFCKTDFEFTPLPGVGSKNPKLNGVKCNGYNLSDSCFQRMTKLDLSFLINASKQLEGKVFVDQEKFFNLLAGNDILIQQINSGMSELEIRDTWQLDLDEFKIKRTKYLIYP